MPVPPLHLNGRCLLAAMFCLLVPTFTFSADPIRSGEQIYRQKCASCHGANGEGSKSYKQQLAGDKSPAQLAAVIAKTMPEDDPGTCTGPDAQKVAEYIHETFYSKAARDRNKPARIDLARLTVRQYRNAVTDLVGSFRWSDKLKPEKGLRGEYFDDRGFRGDKRKLERLDPQVRFDFKTTSPVEGKIDPRQFAIHWNGSVVAPETGAYDFVVRTNQATRLFVNDTQKPLIDAWVKSGSDTEFRGTIFLLGGRAYPIRLEFSKAKQGVDDTKNTKAKPPAPAFVFLEWKRPLRATEAIPAQFLNPVRVAESCVVSTPFPPDDRSMGWERGATVSREWDQAATEAALDVASYIVAKANRLADVRDGAPDRREKLRAFCERFAERAFRRPLTPDQKKRYLERAFESKDLDLAVRRSVVAVLKSPWFLYREVGEKPDSHDVASRLSFGIWDSLPDRELLQAAVSGKLKTREQIARHAERMLDDERARFKLHEFFNVWLKVDRATDVSKDPKKFPDFTPEMVSDLRTSLDLMVDDAVGKQGDFRKVLLSDETYLNGRLAKFYGVKLPADADFQKVKLDPEYRSGVLTHPFLMSAFAYTGESSPIHRGVFIARNILGRTLRPPAEAITPLLADLHPKLTTRERVELQTKPTACVSCHGMINPLGFTLEHFDAVGRYRQLEKGQPINASGAYQTGAGGTAKFNGVRELAKFLASSEEVHASFVDHLFHHVAQQPLQAYGAERGRELRNLFAQKEFSIRQLTAEIATAAAMTPRPNVLAAAPASGTPAVARREGSEVLLGQTGRKVKP